MSKFGYYNTAGEVVETDRLSDALNPWKTYYRSLSNVTVEKYVQYLEVLFGEHPITEAKLDVLFPDTSATWKEFALSVSKEAPELFAWLWTAAPSMPYTEVIIYPYSGNSLIPAPDKRLATLRDVVAGYDKSDFLGNIGVGGYNIFWHMHRLMRNHANTYYVEGVFQSAARVVATYSEEDIEEFVFSNNGYIEGILSAKGLRKQIRKKLNHSTDVTRILGTRKEFKKTRNGVSYSKEYDPVLYGVELEISTAHDVPLLIDAQQEIFFVCKSDSSISGAFSNMVELVTVPQDLRCHRRAWAKFMGGFYDNATGTYPQFDVTNRTDNGMHIHIDRKAFLDSAHTRRFCFFICDSANQDFTTAIAERSASKMSQYAKLPPFHGMKKRSAYNCCLERLTASGKYSAINLSRTNTVEVRIFKGLFNYSTVIKNLEFVDSVLHFTKECSFLNLNIAGFLRWLDGDPSKGLRGQPKGSYRFLRKFLETLDLQEIIETAKIAEIVASHIGAEAILKAVLATGMVPSRNVVGLLNSHFGRKVFIWDNKTKSISVSHKDKAVMHSHDATALKHFVRNSSSVA